MKKEKIFKIVAATSAVTSGVALAPTTVSATPNNLSEVDNGQVIVDSTRTILMGKVNNISSNLRVRSQANTSSAILGYLKGGDTFEITGEQNDFFKINFNGKVGYVSKEFTSKINDSSVSTTSKGKAVNLGGSTLRLRQSASTSSATLASIKEGETFDIIAKSGSWYNVKFAGKIGFVHGDYVQEIKEEDPSTPPVTTVEKGVVYGVEGSNLRVRTAPSTSASTYGYLLNGTEVEITGESGNWYAINYKGQTGYSSKDYIKKNSTTPEVPDEDKPEEYKSFEGEVINASSGLRVREGATTSSQVLGHLYTGAKVTVIGESGSFYKIKYNNKDAYVSKDYIKEIKDGNVVVEKTGVVINASSGLRVREKASTSSTVLGYVYTGDKVTITGEEGDFYKIKYNSKDAYVSKDYIKESTGNDSDSGNDGSVVENKRGKVTGTGGSGLTVRTEASTSSLALGYLMEGQVVELVETRGDWYKIIFNGKAGFVSSKYITIVDNITDGEAENLFNTIFSAMKAHVGSPYVWGGSGEYLTTSNLNILKSKFPNETAKGWYVRAERYVDKGYRAFDCSGLMQWGFRQAGVVIGRTTWAQIGEGREVALSELKPGDLLFYSSLDHVGMYIGDGKWIESPNTNADVRIVDVPWSKVTRARRVLE